MFHHSECGILKKKKSRDLIFNYINCNISKKKIIHEALVTKHIRTHSEQCNKTEQFNQLKRLFN